MKMINEFKDGERLVAQFLVAECNRCISNKSKTYLNMTLQDKTGTIPAKLWDVVDSDFDLFSAGNIVEVSGDVLEYSGALQFKVDPGSAKQIIPGDGFDYSKLVPAAPMGEEALKAEYKSFIEKIENEEVKKVVNNLLIKHQDKLFTWPAAVRNHHNFLGGLAYHSISMAKVAEFICTIYPTLNKDILIGGILIHDLGKITELSGPIATSFTLEGKLIGHISICHAEVKKACEEENISPEMSALLEHMVLAHHGKNEFGSPVTPCTKEAFVCSVIDDLDAKMNILDKALAQTKPGESTAKLFNMDDRYFYKPTFEN